LRIIDTLMLSYPQLVMNKESYKDAWKRQKAETIALMLKSSLDARDKVALKMNLPQNKLQSLLECLPSLRLPTVSTLANSTDWVAVETVIDESVVREILPQLKELGAEGIIEFPLNKIIA